MGRTTPRSDLLRMYDDLLAAYGPQQWWPADTPTEVVIGAVLTQNTAWTNVEKAIASLRKAGALDLPHIAALDEAELAALIRSAGTFRIKARRLQALARWVVDEHGGDLTRALSGPTAEVRQRLLQLHGVGPETADAILLYAGNHPVFVVDAYARRVLRRHGLLTDAAAYDVVQAYFEQRLPRDAQLFNEYHALLVEVGKRHCRAVARCTGCPLAHWPHNEANT